jgi:two-component system, OmpR family, alkaline phosphatase synthesis response regulator PhoP
LNPDSQQLLRRGKEIELTPKEFSLLALFVKRTGCALTRDEILKRVWGYNILVTARSVDRCVNTLRNKIEKNPQSPFFIRTIRDVGYRFESWEPVQVLGGAAPNTRTGS